MKRKYILPAEEKRIMTVHSDFCLNLQILLHFSIIDCNISIELIKCKVDLVKQLS